MTELSTCTACPPVAVALPDPRFLELNRSCLCLPLDRQKIDQALVANAGIPDLGALLSSRENLFAGAAVFVADDDIAAMRDLIAAIERIADTAPYRQRALRRTANGAIITAQPATRGMFMGYDFHLTPDGPKLIEINTNAGGAFLAAALHDAVHQGLDTCTGARSPLTDDFEAGIITMLETEWQLAGRRDRPRTLAIIDQRPQDQYLYPDMLLARDLFDRNGIATIIAGPETLSFTGQTLLAGGRVIDMVYNRLTDFQLRDPAHAALRDALGADAVVVSPAPRHHALLADKKNLAVLTDKCLLADWGVSEADTQTLSAVPRTIEVSPERAEQLWADRRNYFFKPAGGFASRAAYRGAKLTRRVWAEILAGEYVAQTFIAPPVRAMALPEDDVARKFDFRLYTYKGRILTMAARAYQGQTTNFRTAGGGFAPVLTARC